jgi:hypothetical protein
VIAELPVEPAGENIKWYNLLWKTVWQFYTKLNSYHMAQQFHPKCITKKNENLSLHKN